jgi:hypothetical protein
MFLALMAEGRSNTGIAHVLWIAKGTVEKHVTEACKASQGTAIPGPAGTRPHSKG